MELIIVVIQSVAALQSLEVAALAWWVVKLPHKLKGHRSYPQNSLHVHHCRRGRLRRSSRREGDASCMYIHLRGICKEKRTLLVPLLACPVCANSQLVKKDFHIPKQKRHQSYKQHISISYWSLITAGAVFCSSFLHVQSQNPIVTLQAIIAVLTLSNVNWLKKIGCNLLGIGSI